MAVAAVARPRVIADLLAVRRPKRTLVFVATKVRPPAPLSRIASCTGLKAGVEPGLLDPQRV